MSDYKLYLISNTKECKVFIARSEVDAANTARLTGFTRSYTRDLELLSEPRTGISEVLFRFASHVNQGRITLPRPTGAMIYHCGRSKSDGFDNVDVTYDHYKSLFRYRTIPVLKNDEEVLAKLDELVLLKHEIAKLQEMKGKLLDIVAPELKEAA